MCLGILQEGTYSLKTDFVDQEHSSSLFARLSMQGTQVLRTVLEL